MKVLLFANVGTDQNGYYHVGDEAMFLELYRFYQNYFPHYQLSALVSLPSHQSLHVVEMQGLPWPDTKSAALRYFLKLILKTYIWSTLEISLYSSEQKKFISFIQAQNIIHFTGGGNITSECGHWFYYALFVAAAAKLLGKPVIMTSQTIGPFSSWLDTKIAVLVLNTVRSITLREYTNRQEVFLKKSGLRQPQLSRALDAAYCMQTPSVSSKLSRKHGKQVVRIGLSIHSRQHNTESLSELITKTITQLAGQDQQIEILLLPHIFDNKNGFDTKFMQHCLAKLPASIQIRSLPLHALVKEKTELAGLVKALSASCDILISSRYHAVIFALSQAVPCITIVDGHYQIMKNVEALSFVFGSKAHLFWVAVDHPAADKRLLTMLNFVISNRERIHTSIKKKNMMLVAEQQKYILRLKYELQSIAATC